MSQDFISQLNEQGFSTFNMGGNCEALVRQRKNADDELITDVITSIDGGSLPDTSDWLYCSYRGDWTKDADCCPMQDNGDSDSKPDANLVEMVAQQ